MDEEECEEQPVMDCPTFDACDSDLLLEHNCVEHIDPWYAVYYEMRTE
jgi:hypothetical protein